MKKKKKVFVFYGKGVEKKSGFNEFNKKIHEKFDVYSSYDLNVPKYVHGLDYIVVIGGDGAILSAVRYYYDYDIPLVGFNFGTEGFLLNEPEEDILHEILQGQIQIVESRLLQAEIYNYKGQKIGKEFAFNDFYFLQNGCKGSVHLKVWINDELQFVKYGYLAGDGLIVCTPAGSTAYSASAGGGILTVGTNSLIITGICPQIKHRWHTAILPDSDIITIETMDTKFRSVNFLSDGRIIPKVKKVVIKYSDKKVKLIFANSQDYAKKVRDLQFGR